MGLIVAITAGFAVTGCARPADEGNSKDLSSTDGAALAVSVRSAGVDGYVATLARLRGKVVLVDFWATWCPSCVEQFPHTVEMHRKYAGRGLAVVSVSLDEPEDELQVRQFLIRNGANFENLLSEYGGGVKASEAFDLPGSIPCYRVYDRSGKLRNQFAVDPSAAHQFTLGDIEDTVNELLE